MAIESPQAVSAQSLSYLSAAFMAISFWEFVIWMPNEVYAWRKLFGYVRDANGRKLGMSVGEGIAIYLRWTLVACSVSVAPLDFGRPVSCQAAATMTWTFATLSWAGVSLLFTLRLYVMWQRSRIILSLFGFLWVVSLAIWIAVTVTWRASNEPELAPGSAPWCSQSNAQAWHIANWGVEMGFDLCVLVATLIRLRQLGVREGRENGSSRRMRSFILRSNLGYFLVSFILSCAAFIVQDVVQDVVLSQVMTPPTIALAPIVAIRIVFSATHDATIEDSRPASNWHEESSLGGNTKEYQPPTAREAQELADRLWAANNSSVMPRYEIQTVRRKSPPDEVDDFAGAGGIAKPRKLHAASTLVKPAAAHISPSSSTVASTVDGQTLARSSSPPYKSSLRSSDDGM